jgi:ribose transport system ATP-binding protein
VTVLKDAHLKLAPGTIHGLVGQNGSGKSTLIKLISGVYIADPGGEIFIDGQHVGPPINPGKLHDDGIAFVHQDLGLVPDLSVRENVRVGRHSVRGVSGWIDIERDRRATQETFDFLGVDIDVDAPVNTLIPSKRVAVALARAMQDRHVGSGIIVFDETFRAIPPESVEFFYEMVRQLANQGTSILIVSHDLQEVLDLADSVTALRNGRVVETGVPTKTLDEGSLTRLILGKDGDLDNFTRTMPAQKTGDTVRISAAAGGRVQDFSAQIARGEVVGVTGSINSGISDLAGLLGGDRTAQGEVTVGTKTLDLESTSPRALLAAGIAYIPSDRADKGLAMDLTVEENITLTHLRGRSKPWSIGRGWREKLVHTVLEDFDVVPRRADVPVATLSGGNQQKVLMGKWLSAAPEFLILDDPTQAVDVGARSAVLRASRQAALDGAAVLLCSSAAEDLSSICDRVLILDQGVVVKELVAPMTDDHILDATFSPTEDHS